MDSLILGTLSTGDWVAVGVACFVVVLSVAPLVWLCWLFVSVGDDAMVRVADDVQRFVDLTWEARLELTATPRLPLLDPKGAAATTAAIERFAARKELARKALTGRPLSSPQE